MVLAQVGILLLFIVVAAIRLISGDVPARSIDPELSWLNPLEISSYQALLSGMLLAVFIYWGWESAVNLTEESEDSARAPGLAGRPQHGDPARHLHRRRRDDDRRRRPRQGPALRRRPGAVRRRRRRRARRRSSFLLVLAIVTSGLASTQTTILPASRTSLSMATRRRLPEGVRPDPPEVRDARLLDDRDRRGRDRLVRRRQHRLRELPLRLALGAVADDRLLLRADRDRLRDLLAPRARPLGQELPDDRRRAR